MLTRANQSIVMMPRDPVHETSSFSTYAPRPHRRFIVTAIIPYSRARMSPLGLQQNGSEIERLGSLGGLTFSKLSQVRTLP